MRGLPTDAKYFRHAQFANALRKGGTDAAETVSGVRDFHHKSAKILTLSSGVTSFVRSLLAVPPGVLDACLRKRTNTGIREQPGVRPYADILLSCVVYCMGQITHDSNTPDIVLADACFSETCFNQFTAAASG